MTINATTGSFGLSILGYETKTNNTCWRDRNSLRCEVSTDWQEQRDTQAAPLRIWELDRLLNGLHALWNRATTHLSLTFAEPGLSMDVTTLPQNQYRLRVQLDHALTPAWHRYPGFPVELDLTLTRRQLRQAIKELTGELAHFPER